LPFSPAGFDLITPQPADRQYPVRSSALLVPCWKKLIPITQMTLAELSSNHRRSTRRTGWLSIVVGEQHPFLCDAIDIRSSAAHQPAMTGSNIEQPNIVSENNENIRRSRRGMHWHASHDEAGQD
jgi:hypothetical protein